MRIAHILMVHKNPRQVLRLVERLNHPFFDIYIHVDNKVDILEYEFLLKIPRVKFIKSRITCNWGGWSFTNAIIQSLKEVVDYNQNYDFVNLISGQDYPIHSSEYIYEYFSKRLGKNFLHIEEKDSVWFSEALDRYEKFHFTDAKFKGKYFLQNILNLVSKKRKFPDGMEFHGGSKSSWWTISYDCAVYLTSKLHNNKELKKFFKYSWGSDEFVIASIIMNSEHGKNTTNDNLRYIEWPEDSAHPRILSIGDLNAITNSEMIFARKFDIAVDAEILDKLDKMP
ncbi:beta-1,6-N-acetylglucosaminyltransferase [Pedobacter sp. Leaf170]|uniref:beta-1,6-N-acetylglucosaminyltransferase n=1 Tax=Pedobacter sp. Leaf170 TaxID=2876558 RepID=UPI001E597FE6|nr:beta-1,6-N-acetylglucosaminyltransferase [Pedobacter sp. Leaf170]